MKIAVTKKQRRNRMVCTRDDGSFSSAELGPGLPHHDFAHYVVETTLQLKNGFFGSIARGMSFTSLSDKEVIKSLGTESWTAEILAGALGSLATGACTIEQFPALVNSGMTRFKDFDASNVPTSTQIALMLKRLQELLARWSQLGDGETLLLEFRA